MNPKIENSWKTILQSEFEKDYFKLLSAEIEADYLLGEPATYPPQELVFNAFNLCPIDQTKVVILGQDPYHGAGQAMGLSFSVPEGVRTPPSLLNIYKEIHQDTDTPIPEHGDLTHWATQGVLLLNATLTVEAGKAGSHQGRGWEIFTDSIIEKISHTREHIVFLLWGNFARSKAPLIDTNKHQILEAPHPSPLSARKGFFGCQHFSKTNEYLKKNGEAEIIW